MPTRPPSRPEPSADQSGSPEPSAATPGPQQSGGARWLSAWAIPRPALLLAGRISVLLVVPLVAVLFLAGATAAVGVAMGYVGCVAPALMVPRRAALSLAVLPATTGAVSSAVSQQAFAAACFVAMACLLVAPANMVRNGLLAGVPTVAAVLTSLPMELDPAVLAGWMLAGGAYAVVVLGPLRKPSAPVGVDVRTAWTHAIAMGAAVAMTSFLVITFEVSHGYWICMTLTIVLRPYGSETLTAARQRVLGTVAGALLALLLAVVLPKWAVLSAVLVLLLLMVSYISLGRTGQQLVFATPVIVFLASGGAGVNTLGVAIERVSLTLLGAALAGLLALSLARADRARARSGRRGTATSSDPDFVI